jgi:glutaredoxin/glutathione-dependent peroxiredoxin
MSIQIGDRIPEINIKRINVGIDTIDTINTYRFFEGKQMVLFSVPGAFTPTCSEKHLPGYIEHLDAFRDKGIGVACMSVNDVRVMQAWTNSQGAPADMEILADGNGDFAKALGLEMDASAYGMGIRSKRFAMYVDNGVVRLLEVEAPGEFRVSSAEHMLEKLG